jgi:hypothetical protein
MITCANCGIGFSPGYRYCPRCKEFEAPFAQRVEFLTSQAEAQLEAGESLQDVEAWLIESGFAPLDAAHVVAARGRKVRGRTRRYGIRRFVAGLFIMAGGTVILAAQFFAPRLFRSARRLFRFLSWTFGGAALIIGVIATLTGLYSMMTGRESSVAAPDDLQDLFRSSKH